MAVQKSAAPGGRMESSVTDRRTKINLIQQRLIFWGRRKRVSAFSGLLSLGFMVACPLSVICLYVCIRDFDASFVNAACTLVSYGVPGFFIQYTPWPRLESFIGYTSWLLFQAFLYFWLPGKTVTAPPTPGGNTLLYRVNGINSWIATVITASVLSATGAIPLYTIAEHWGGLVAAANIYGILATVFGWMKGHLAPSITADRRFSGMYLSITKISILTHF